MFRVCGIIVDKYEEAVKLCERRARYYGLFKDEDIEKFIKENIEQC